MAKGSVSKEIITAKLLEVFDGSFVNCKEIRVPMTEDGAPIEIKITLTAAKDIVGGGASVNDTWDLPSETTTSPASVEPTAEEKENVAKLLKNLGF